jgi:predicted amidohydrolase YtcJ
MPAGTPLYDMGGQFVMPGFVDSHNHALQGGESLLKAYVDDSLVSAADLEAFARASKENGKGMRGRFLVINGLNITTWSHIPELQATFNGNDYAKQPVLLRGSDGHTGWGNRPCWQKRVSPNLLFNRFPRTKENSSDLIPALNPMALSPMMDSTNFRN